MDIESTFNVYSSRTTGPKLSADTCTRGHVVATCFAPYLDDHEHVLKGVFKVIDQVLYPLYANTEILIRVLNENS